LEIHNESCVLSKDKFVSVFFLTLHDTGEVDGSSKHFWPLHCMEVSGQIQDPAALLPEKESLVPIGHVTGWVSDPD